MYRDEGNEENGTFDIVFEDRTENIKSSAVYKEQNNKTQGYRKLVLNLFEKSPEVGRLLVRLHDRNALYSMAQSPDDVARAELSQIIVDLLSFDLTPAENELISDVLSGLINQAERNLRRALSERLAVMEGVPLRIVLKIASDEIFVADPMLKKSADLKDFDLIYILKAKGKEHWQSIAQRPQISEKLVDMLAETNDLMTAVHLSENKTINLSQYSVDQFFEMAKKEDVLADPLLKRSEIPKKMVTELYSFVGEELKTYIKQNFTDLDFAEDIVDGIILDLMVNAEKNEFEPDGAMKDAEEMMRRGLLTPITMLDQLKAGDTARFVLHFSIYCGLTVDLAEKIVAQKSGQAMAIACRATRISKSDFTNMFLLTSRVRGERVVEEKNLSRAIRYYNSISEQVAKKLLNRQRH